MSCATYKCGRGQQGGEMNATYCCDVCFVSEGRRHSGRCDARTFGSEPPHESGGEIPDRPAWWNDVDDITAGFRRFHAENPHIYPEVERRAFALYRAGARRIGIKLIFEVMRYDHLIRTQGEPWKLNNSYTALYARLLIFHHPELEAVIETRVRLSARGAEPTLV